MIVIVFIILGLILVVLQATVLMLNPLWVAAPDLYYILVAYLAYRFDLLRALLIILPLGWMLDTVSGVILGTYPFICFGAFFLLRFMSIKMPVRESLYQIPLIGVSYLVVYRIVFVVLDFLNPGTLVPWSWLEMFVRALLIVFLAIPLFRFFEFVNQRLFRSFSSFKIMRVRSGNRYR